MSFVLNAIIKIKRMTNKTKLTSGQIHIHLQQHHR
uniref:Uncharacterized protein n=1 Tax=Anguilla anguilla TaxID=7936 RepID=A0A0E9VGG1_ANGAN